MRFARPLQCAAAQLSSFVLIASIIGASGQAIPAAGSEGSSGKTAPAVKVTTRMVSLEIVARDKQGRPVPGLTAKDFQLFEQVPPKKDHRPQAIAVFREVNWNQLRAAAPAPSPLPAGIYSNAVDPKKVQAPPTVILFDGINTNLDAQLQVHAQIKGILKTIPADVPVAIFLMADRLRLLQGFTTDPNLLRDAANKSMHLGQIHTDQDPLDDPNNLSALLENVPAGQLPPGALQALESFEQQTYSFEVGIRIQNTMDALRGLARYLNGYPGRKNVIWISTAFPLFLAPTENSSGQAFFTNLQPFIGDMQDVGASLMEGKIAIYPVDAGGVETQSRYQAATISRQPWSGQRAGQSLMREDAIRQGRQQVMRDLADETGGRPCIGDNDFADCVKKAVEDSSSYYELAYYPDSGPWNGEYHRILLKSNRPGIHVRFREGYYARPLPEPGALKTTTTSEKDPTLQRAACEDPLIATGILVVVKPIPANQPNAAKYFLAIDGHLITFKSLPEGKRQMDVTIAACTFDKTRHPLQYFQQNSLGQLTPEQFTSASNAVTQTFEFGPKPETASVRLLIRDTPSGRIGSVDIPYQISNEAGHSANKN